MKNVFFLSFCFCFCVQNYVFLLKIVCKEKNIQKGNPKKLCGIVNFGSTKLSKPTWYCSYYAKKNKKRQSGSIKWHCRCTAQKHWMYNAKTLYAHLNIIRKKSTNL